jgi:hypothetical protein
MKRNNAQIRLILALLLGALMAIIYLIHELIN